jgi:hypothetical protein
LAIKKASLLYKFNNAKTTKISRGLTTGAEGNRPHTGTRVKLEKNSVFFNSCATFRTLHLLTSFEILQEMLLIISHIANFSHIEGVKMTSAYFDYTQ